MRERLKKYCPTPAAVALGLALLALILSLLAGRIPALSEFLNSTLGRAVRFVLAKLSSLLPFSLFESVLLLALPVFVGVTVVAASTLKGFAARVRGIVALLGALSLLYTAHVFTMGFAYSAPSLASRMGLEEKSSVSRDELYSLALLLRGEVNSLAPEIPEENSESTMPYGVYDASSHIVSGYTALLSEYPIADGFSSYAKAVSFGGVMADMGITGIYGYFTGEANISLAYPDYTLPYTVAHELAHQRGIARENEANFVAFLACINSPDPYVRYSGYLNMYEYVVYALYSLDRDAYYELDGGLSATARADMEASRAVSRAHKDSFLNKLTDKVNDTYLKVNGTEGVVSYNNTVRLAAAYYAQP